MFRQASRLLARSMIPRSRAFSSEALAEPEVDSAFVEAWKKVAPNQDPPKTPISFMKPRPPTPASIPAKVTVNFVLPYQSELSSKEVPWHFYEVAAAAAVLLDPNPVTFYNAKNSMRILDDGVYVNSLIPPPL